MLEGIEFEEAYSTAVNSLKIYIKIIKNTYMNLKIIFYQME